ncbi:MAG: efflux RND transporter periplasmic adaptor subunit [Planctomycetia bacterium]
MRRLSLLQTWLGIAIAVAGNASVANPAGAPVVVARVEEVELAAAQSFVGTVYPARVSDVGSAVDGRVVRLPVEDGQRVAAGEPIAELLRGLLEIERSGATAEAERRAQMLAELRAGSRPEEIDRARAAVAGSEARVEYARNRLARLSRLAERGTSTEDELLVAQTEVSQAESQLAGARAALALAEAGPRQEAIAQAAAALAAQEAEVARIDDQLAKHTIRAPFAGWVVERFTEEGQWVSRGGLVARIAELDRLEIEVQVPELAVGTLAVGADVRLEIDAAQQQTWIGRLTRIVPQADLLSRSFPVKVLLENRVVDGEPVLRGGLLARAWLPVGKTGPATVVPKDALVLGGGQPLIYVVDPATAPGTGTVRPVPVVLGAAVAGTVEIRGDLGPGQLVVTRGNERLRPGMQVSFAP